MVLNNWAMSDENPILTEAGLPRKFILVKACSQYPIVYRTARPLYIRNADPKRTYHLLAITFESLNIN